MILRLNKRPRLIPRTAHRDVHRVHRQIKRKTKRLWTQISPSGIRNTGNLTNVVYTVTVIVTVTACLLHGIPVHPLQAPHQRAVATRRDGDGSMMMSPCVRGLIRPRRWGPACWLVAPHTRMVLPAGLCVRRARAHQQSVFSRPNVCAQTSRCGAEGVRAGMPDRGPQTNKSRGAEVTLFGTEGDQVSLGRRSPYFEAGS